MCYRQENKKFLFTALAVILLVLFYLFFSRVEHEQQRMKTIEGKIEALGTEEFRLLIYDLVNAQNNEYDVYIEWWKNKEDNVYYLFLPSKANVEFKYLFNCYNTIIIDDIEVHPGDKFNLAEGTYEVKLGESKKVSLRVMQSQNIASMFIETVSGSLELIREDIDNIDSGKYILFDEKGKINCCGILEQMKGRGNVAFKENKKPFALRMKQKASVLGMGESKKWSLLANATDKSLIRNELALELGNRIEMEYVLDREYIDLYVNGEYQGNYQISEKAEIGENRVAIRDLKEDMEDINPNVIFSEFRVAENKTEEFQSLRWVPIANIPLDISNGYLLELDIYGRYLEEPCGFVTSRNQSVVAKDPKYLNNEQILFIANRYKDMEDALYNTDGYNENTGLYYYDYLDIESFAKKYLVDEATKNLDASLTSFYMYLTEDDGKFHAGPIWDYDVSFGITFSRGGYNLEDPYSLFASENIQVGEAECNIHYLLCQQSEFQEAYKEIYFGKMRDQMIDMVDNSFTYHGKEIEASAMMNAVRWNSFECGSDYEKNRKAFWNSNEQMKSFLGQRIQYLDEVWK